MGLLYLKHNVPAIATAFTTHATTVGRSIAGNNKALYDYLPGYFGDQMADELNVQSKHSVEKRAARESDVFTTVSDITARECTQLLERVPLVTPNGFEPDFVPSGAKYTSRRKEARKALISLAEHMIGYKCEGEPFLVATAGRYEYKNKGIDVFIDAIDALRRQPIEREVIAFVMVPAWVYEARHDLQMQLHTASKQKRHAISDPIITHTLHNQPEDVILNRLHQLGFRNEPADKVKIIFVPSYLTGHDGILDRTYYQLLIGMDATVFPSYYEPWGYTPLESVAFGVPTVTTDLSGFGNWAKSIGAGRSLASGVMVIHRSDFNSAQVVDEIAATLCEAIKMSPASVTKMRAAARKVAEKARWDKFIRDYVDAFDQALRSAEKRNN
jgi:glycosyltransferase involved in cell wall biosynthesis